MLSNSLLEKRVWAKEFEIEGMSFRDIDWVKKGTGMVRGIRSRIRFVSS